MVLRIRQTARLVGIGGVATGLVLLGAVTRPAVAADPPSTGAATGGGRVPGPVVTWAASADRTGATFDEQTVRLIVHTSIGGSGVSIRLSNAFGSQPITFASAYVGTQAQGAAVVPGSNQRATFGGNTTVTVPVGAAVVSDSLPGVLSVGQNLAVSLYLRGTSGVVTGHNLALQTSFVSVGGDHAAEEGAAAFPSARTNWFWLDAVTVAEARGTGSVATLGDSITDGVGSTANTNQRWPDLLGRRLNQRPEPHRMGVANEGISGNKVLADGAGVSAQARLDRDVLSQPGVRSVVLLEGINDIRGDNATSPDQLIAAYRQIVARVHATGRCVVGGTLTPFQGDAAFTPAREAVRAAVNTFIRESGEFDAVVDFDRATRDPANPSRFLPALDSGDHLHPGNAGYQAMADAIDPTTLTC